MFDKIDKLLDWYLIIILSLLLLIMIGTFLVGPLILGLLVSPYLFLMYIASLFLAPPTIMVFIMFIGEVKDGISIERNY